MKGKLAVGVMVSGAMLFCGCRHAQELEMSPRLQEYVEVLRDCSRDEPEELMGGNSLKWESKSSAAVLWANKKYVSFQEVSWSYTGGAHGMTRTRVGTLDRTSGKLLALKDLVSGKKEMALLEQAWQKALILRFQAKDWQDCLKNKLLDTPALTGNFYLDEKGITFVYDPYDIACFAAGTIRISVPWKELPEAVFRKFAGSREK